MTNRVLFAAQFVPSYAAQILMDESIYWHRRVDGSFVSEHQNAYYNLAIQIDRSYKKPEGEIDEREQAERPIPWVTPEDTESVFQQPWPGIWAAVKLFGWGAVAFAAAYLGLRRQEHG
jgi:poly-beta-hydroxyalkanoate depolymerase